MFFPQLLFSFLLFQRFCYKLPSVPREFPNPQARLISTADTGLCSSFLLPGVDCLPSFHPADYSQKTQAGWYFFSDFSSLCSQVLKTYYFIFQCSGQTMKLDLKLEDGRIGEHPEVIYHVFHTLLFGGLALLFDGYLDKHIFYIIWISNIKYC